MTPAEARKILGWDGWDGSEELKVCYYRMAKIAHPDAGGSVDKFLKVKTAYDLLRGKESGQVDYSWINNIKSDKCMTKDQWGKLQKYVQSLGLRISLKCSMYAVYIIRIDGIKIPQINIGSGYASARNKLKEIADERKRFSEENS